MQKHKICISKSLQEYLLQGNYSSACGVIYTSQQRKTPKD